MNSDPNSGVSQENAQTTPPAPHLTNPQYDAAVANAELQFALALSEHKKQLEEAESKMDGGLDKANEDSVSTSKNEELIKEKVAKCLEELTQLISIRNSLHEQLPDHDFTIDVETKALELKLNSFSDKAKEAKNNAEAKLKEIQRKQAEVGKDVLTAEYKKAKAEADLKLANARQIRDQAIEDARRKYLCN